MNIKDLKPASALALRLGVKSVGYGPASSGKTPLSNTAPNPVMCVTEPGMLSMRKSPLKYAYDAYTAKRIDEFFEWVFGSTEVKKFDTIILDSLSQMCETYIEDAGKRNKHGLAAYGEANTKVMEILLKLYYMPQKHVYLIAKQEVYNDNGTMMKRPYFPGKELPIRIPHLFDLVMRIAIVPIPGFGNQLALQCQPDFDVIARDRSGNLLKYEEPDLTKLFTKAML